MKTVHNALYSLFFLFFVGLVAACSSSSGKVTIEGRMLHMNQATFYVYSTDGAISGIDTIQVQGGRFEYRKEVSAEGTLVIIFPNYSQMPVFVKPGADISIKGDAANLKQLEIKGTSENKEMTEWRMNNVGASPAEQKAHAELYIKDHPGSLVSLWLLRQFYVTAPKPNVKKAVALLKAMVDEEPDNIGAKRMLTDLGSIGTVAVGDRPGAFTAKDINGNKVTNNTLQHGKWIVMTCASWNGDSQGMVRSIANRKRYGGQSQSGESSVDNVLVICLEASDGQCRNTVKYCQAENLTIVNDTAQMESPLLKAFGFTTVPDNIVLENGKVTRRHVPLDKL